MLSIQALPLAQSAILFSIVYFTVLTVRRLYFSPISHIPGPRLAAATLLYQFYYDVICGGQYVWKVRELHERYGPIVRISPYEVHVNEPAFLDELYPGPGLHKRDKWKWSVQSPGAPGSSFLTNLHDQHRLRRSAINPFLSKGSIRNIQPLLDTNLDKFMERFGQFRDTGDVIILNHAFAALTNDISTEFAFGTTRNMIQDPKFDPSFSDNWTFGLDLHHLMSHLPLIMRILEALPENIASLAHPAYAMFLREKRDIIAQAQITMQSPKLGETEHQTIFHEIMNSKLPPEEKTMARLGDEAIVIVTAGTLTTAWTLSLAMYYLLSTSSILEKLKQELDEAIPDPSVHSPLKIFEGLPYLTACIKEALRLGYGSSGRIPMVSPEEVMILKSDEKDYEIPPGTPTSMTIMLLHHDESIFPDSKTFRPERWLENPRLDKLLMSFGKGTRQCAGINLAYADLYLTLGTIFRHYGSLDCRHPADIGVLELFETDYRDVECIADMFVPKMWKGTKGVRVRVIT